MSLLGEMEAARKNKSPMIGKDAMVCVSQVKDITHALAVPWQCPGRQEMPSRKAKATQHTTEAGPRHLGSEAQQRSQGEREPVRSRALPSVSKIR